MGRNKKSQVAIMLPALLCIIAMLVSACGGSNSPANQSGTKAPDSKQIFRYADGGLQDFGTLDPALPQSADDSYAQQLVFTGMEQLDDSGNVIDQLASSHDVSADGLTYTFHLRPNLKFSDGTPLTADDVAYSINRTLLPATNSTVSTYLKLVKGYTDITTGKVPTLIGSSLIVKDPNTISIVISKPAAYFLDALTYPTSYVVEKSLITKYGANWTDHLTEGGGDGPFKVKTYTHGKVFSVVPNPNYYGPIPQLKELDISFITDNATAYKAYLNGQYDWTVVPATNLPQAKKRSDFYTTPLLVTRYLSYNYLAKPFDNLNIRKAFGLAINKDILANEVLHGAVTATNHIVPNGMYGYDPNAQGPDGTTNTSGNQAQAVALLAQGLKEAGYSSVSSLPPITLTSYSGNTNIANVTNAIADQWRTILKVSVKVSLIDFNTFNQAQTATTGNNSLQLWLAGWQADYPDPQDWLTVFFGKGQDYNNNNYGDSRNPGATEQQQVQTSLSQADAELNKNKRLSDYNTLEQKLLNDVGWTPLYQSQNLIVQNTKLHGYKTNALDITAPNDWGGIYFTT